jgi:hypothetical protein
MRRCGGVLFRASTMVSYRWTINPLGAYLSKRGLLEACIHVYSLQSLRPRLYACALGPAISD